MQLICKQCHATIPAGDVNLDRAIAKCARCDAVFSFAHQLAPTPPTAPARNREVPMPRRISVLDLGDRLTITRRWRSLAVLPLLLFCAVWDGFLIVWYSIASNTNGPAMMFLFPLIHVAVGIAMTYFALALLLNTTTIQVTPDSLVIRHGPLPWPGARSLDPAALTQLYCRQKTRHGENGRVHHTYSLVADTLDGKTVKLLTGLDQPEQAIFLEHRLEHWLGIEDNPVPGEFVA